MIGDLCPVACGYEGGYGAEVRVCLGSNVLVKVKLLFDLLFASSTNELQSQRDKQKFWVCRARGLEDLNSLLRISPEQGASRHHSVDRRWILRARSPAETLGVVFLEIAPVADLQTELTMVRSFGRHAVELGKMTFLAVLADLPFPLSGVRRRCTRCKTTARIET